MIGMNIIRCLDDDSKELLGALHGEGMIKLAQRPTKGIRAKDTAVFSNVVTDNARRTSTLISDFKLGCVSQDSCGPGVFAVATGIGYNNNCVEVTR